MILLETHALVWPDAGDTRLGRRALDRIRTAWREDALAVAAISFWEVRMLVAGGRLILPEPTGRWRRSLLWRRASASSRSTATSGLEATRPPGLHGDPADCLIAATAVAHEACLVTANRRLLGCRAPGLRCLDAAR